MTRPSFLRIGLCTGVLFLGCLTFSAFPVVAQHSGGGHASGGGGHAAGGAAHGGGSGFSGGGARSAGAAAPRGGPGGGNFYRQAPSAPNRYVNPNYANPAYGGRVQRAPNGYAANTGAVNAERDGQWHSFGNAGGNSNGSTAAARTSSGNPGQVSGGWQSFAGPTRSGSTDGAPAGVSPAGNSSVRSFAGEGRNIVETTPARPAAPNFAAARLGFAGSGITGTRLGGSPFAGTALPARSNFVSNSGFGFRGGGFGFTGFGGRFGFGRFGFNRFGYGYYPFFGIGWPFWGFGAGNSCPYGPGYFDAGYGFGYGYDPFSYNASACTGLWGTGYGPWDVNPYPTAGPYVYPYDYPDDKVYPEEQGPPPPSDQNQQYQQEQQPYAPTPGEVYNGPVENGPDINEPTEAQRNAMKPVELFLKSGGVFEATIYWIANDKLNYVTDNGAVITVDIDQLDLQRTISENARRGVPFTLSVQGNNVPPPAQSAPAPPSP